MYQSQISPLKVLVFVIRKIEILTGYITVDEGHSYSITEQDVTLTVAYTLRSDCVM